ncbi:hypothetical protein OCU04_002704 [Sclerotinia nivalis]|uniref:LysM domain-containing protein n=1 Tax=Sclerotinia nivalis TaxID=352851 RepID=A0A9X0DNV9_9HELO|nr:hypothetical protein OCU04_002704 [Sclerotinia nivalis]
MKLFHLTSYALSLHLVGAYLVTPDGPAAPGSTSACSEWVEQSYDITCAIIEEFYGLTEAEFEAWNPATTELGIDCTLIPDLYYCVQINFSTMSTLVTSPPTSISSYPSASLITTSIPTTTSISSFTSSTTLLSTTSTTTGNGITTPTPYQTGIATNCDSFYLVVSGDECGTIASKNGISLTQFYAWNPAVGSTCEYLDLGDYVCIDIIGVTISTSTSASTTSSSNGVTTPTPIQTGMTSQCESFHLVVSGDECDTIAQNAGASFNDFYLWNPAVGSSCQYLDVGDYVCTGILPITCTSASVLAAPTEYASTCGASGFSNDGATSLLLVSYTAGSPYVESAAACGAQCLTMVACTNLYFIQGSYCNLHEETSTFFESTEAGAYSYYEAVCFSSGEACGSFGFSNGGTLLVSYTSGSYVESAAACGAQCLSTAACTNLYFIEGSYCNLHAGEATFFDSTSAGYYSWYQYDCFEC